VAEFPEPRPAVAFATAVIEQPVQRHSFFDETGGVLVPAQQPVAPANSLQCRRLRLLVPDDPVQALRLQVVIDGLVVMALAGKDRAKVAVQVGVLGRVAKFREQLSRAPQFGERLVIAAQRVAGAREAAADMRLRRAVASRGSSPAARRTATA
jgi:hypothetical protein